MAKGHAKDTYQLKEYKQQDVRLIQEEHFFKICQKIMLHHTKDFPFNLNNVKEEWCSICEENNLDIVDYILNMKTKPNYHSVYQKK